jgi:drug/metabolite transporter (DMT)-like permease
VLGLVESHAVFTCYPLLIAALSGPVLGEKVGWRRWTAIGIGFVGVLIILQPGYAGVFALGAGAAAVGLPVRALRVADALCLAGDAAGVSFFWTGDGGGGGDDALGLWNWEPMSLPDWGWMGALCCTGHAWAHYLADPRL